MSIVSSFISSWQSVYKHNGGARALARCAWGTLRILASSPKTGQPLDTEIVTFSVVPQLTLCWSVFANEALRGVRHRTLIGDCSGGFRYPSGGDFEVYPLYNFLHGRKLDYVMEHVCTAEYVVVSDDDIMWLSGEPYAYAMEVFRANPQCAVVSLMPRETASSLLRDVAPEPMGSYCLVIRRSIWLKEKLSFQMQDAPTDRVYEWFYDTADFANRELLLRGYSVDIAPAAVRDNLVTIEGASTWTLKIHKHRGNIEPLVRGIDIRQEKAYTALLFLDGIGAIMAKHFSDDSLRYVIQKPYAERATEVCLSLLAEETAAAIRDNVRLKLERIEKHLASPHTHAE